MNCKVLVTDDNMLDNAILRNYLHGEKISLVSAANGMEALEILESHSVDLIILDLVMPVLDGFKFLQFFSKTKMYEEIPIIVTSSISDAKDIERVLEYRIFDYVIKPLDHINRLILVNKIRNAINYRKLLLKTKKLKNF